MAAMALGLRNRCSNCGAYGTFDYYMTELECELALAHSGPAKHFRYRILGHVSTHEKVVQT